MLTVDAGDPDALAHDVAARFTDLHSRAPLGVFAAPGRVNLLGEHVDYNGGLCLPIALPHATYAAIGPRDDGCVTVTSRQQAGRFEARLDDLGPGHVDGWAAYAVGVLWALREEGWELPGADVVLDSRVPLGAGLSSSAALECAVAIGAAALVGKRLDDDLRRLLVRACMRAEGEVAGAPTGGMDQTVALFGQQGAALLLDCRDWTTRAVGWDPDAADVALLVVDTRASHDLTDGGYAARRADCEQAADVLGVGLLREVDDTGAALGRLTDERLRRRARHVFSEIARVRHAVDLLEDGDFDELGRVFTASHVSLRDDYEVSCAELDVVVEVALEHGALGARMTGGGFGGSAIALLPAERAAATADAIESAYAKRGWTAPAGLTATPGPGARRLLAG